MKPSRYILAAAVMMATLLGMATPRHSLAERKAPPAGVATNYPAVDVHSKEEVAIAADPYNTREKASVFRIDYLKYGFMPIRIIVTNNSSQALSLADAHIDFVTAAGQSLGTAEIPDVERRVNRIKNPGGGIKLPGPLPRIGNKSATSTKAIVADFHEFEYSAATVPPHSTRSGFFFYDLQGLSHPLSGARLSIDTVRFADGRNLYFFAIPFDKYLATQKARTLNQR